MIASKPDQITAALHLTRGPATFESFHALSVALKGATSLEVDLAVRQYLGALLGAARTAMAIQQAEQEREARGRPLN